jgi:hypothetical protein
MGLWGLGKTHDLFTGFISAPSWSVFILRRWEYFSLRYVYGESISKLQGIWKELSGENYENCQHSQSLSWDSKLVPFKGMSVWSSARKKMNKPSKPTGIQSQHFLNTTDSPLSFPYYLTTLSTATITYHLWYASENVQLVEWYCEGKPENQLDLTVTVITVSKMLVLHTGYVPKVWTLSHKTWTILTNRESICEVKLLAVFVLDRETKGFFFIAIR